MHANLNTTLFYDLILLIECSYWKSTPTLNAKIEEHSMQKSRSPLHHPRRRGVASPSFPCARQFGVIMHSGMKGGATITDSQPVINNNNLI